MGNYLLHSLKYFIKLVVLMALIYLLMYFTNTLSLSIEALLGQQGFILLVAITVLSLVYPSLGFVKRNIVADIVVDKEDIIKAFMVSGYTLDKEENGVMTFHLSSMFKRALSLFDDKITLYQEGNQIVLEGARKGVVQVEFRVGNYTRNKQL